MTFTIVTPSFNYGRFIGECLQSVAGQISESEERAGRPRSLEIEHLVMDAGSTDDTAEVVSRFPHARFFQEPDKGMTDGINKGFRKAGGEWVMWLNADDRLLPGALMAVKEFAERHPGADVIYGCWNFVNEDGRFIRRMTVFPFDRGMIANHGCYIASTATFFRRSTTIDEGHLLNIAFRSVMDGEYFARLSALGKCFEYLPSVLADFRLHDGSISQRNIGKRDIDSVLERQRQFAESRAIRRVYGIKPFEDEMLNGIAEGILYQAYRLKKGLLRRLHARSCRDA